MEEEEEDGAEEPEQLTELDEMAELDRIVEKYEAFDDAAADQTGSSQSQQSPPRLADSVGGPSAKSPADLFDLMSRAQEEAPKQQPAANAGLMVRERQGPETSPAFQPPPRVEQAAPPVDAPEGRSSVRFEEPEEPKRVSKFKAARQLANHGPAA